MAKDKQLLGYALKMQIHKMIQNESLLFGTKQLF